MEFLTDGRFGMIALFRLFVSWIHGLLTHVMEVCYACSCGDPTLV